MATKDEIVQAARAPVIETTRRQLDGSGEADDPAAPPSSQETPGTATLPPPGYGRQEVLRMRGDALQKAIEARAEQMSLGMLDTNKLREDDEILRYYVDILEVTNPQPYRQYCWVECGLRDDHPEHVHHKQTDGWKFVGPEDAECPDVPRSPQGHRRLGTTVLMWIELEKWITLQARIHARSMRQRGDLTNADNLISIAERHGVQVRVLPNWQDFSPEVQRRTEQRYLDRQRTLQRSAERINQELRQGTAHLNYGHQRRATL